eukprot:6212811-Alexandrium_andersonii.AAC.1
MLAWALELKPPPRSARPSLRSARMLGSAEPGCACADVGAEGSRRATRMLCPCKPRTCDGAAAWAQMLWPHPEATRHCVPQ